MKVEKLKDDDISLKKAMRTAATRDTINRIKNIKEHSFFKVGDVLIHKAILAKSPYNTKKKYVVVYIDDYGLVYVKTILSKGVLSKNTHCITSKFLLSTHYVHAPEIAESILLDQEYDPIKEMVTTKSEKDKIRRYNKSVSLGKMCEIDFIHFVARCNKGDKLWLSSDMLGKFCKEYSVLDAIISEDDVKKLRCEKSADVIVSPLQSTRLRLIGSNQSRLRISFSDDILKRMFFSKPRIFNEAN